MSPKIVNKDEKKKEIGTKALFLFSKEGFLSTSMAKIAKVAEIGKGTIYEYFKSKDELISYSLKLYIERIEESVDRLIRKIDNPKEKLRIYTLEVTESIISDQATAGVVLSIFQLFVSNENHDPKVSVKEMFTKARETIEQILVDGVEEGIFVKKAEIEKEAIAINLIAFIDGIWMHSMVNSSIDLRDQLNYYLENLFISIESKG